MSGTQPLTPTVVKEVPAASPQTGITDLLFGTAGMASAIMLAALVTGVLAGWLFIKIKQWRHRHDHSVPESHVRLKL